MQPQKKANINYVIEKVTCKGKFKTSVLHNFNLYSDQPIWFINVVAVERRNVPTAREQWKPNTRSPKHHDKEIKCAFVYDTLLYELHALQKPDDSQ